MLTTEKFKSQMQLKEPNIEILSEYQGDKVKVKCRCKVCGNEWEDSPTHLKQGRGCSQCRKNAQRELYKEDFIRRANEIHNNKYDYSKVKYINQQTYVTIICKEHGEFQQIPNSHLRGRGCPQCALEHLGENRIKSTEQFINEARKVHGNKYDYSKVNYTGCYNPITIICSKHGEFNQSANKHLQGQGCPKCQLKSQAKLYEKLKQSFPNEEILFEVGRNIVSWLGLQRFDIYFPKYNIAVEYNGRQHYIEVNHFGGILGLKETQERDSIKRQKCKENNCTLFEIKYDYNEDDYNNLVKSIKNIIK